MQKENEVVLSYVAEERGEGNWAGRVRKGEATVGCRRGSCRVSRACRKRKKTPSDEKISYVSVKVRMAPGSAEQGGKAW